MTLPFYSSARIASPHGAFFRPGGVSRGPFASLNASHNSGDELDAVEENRRRVRDTLGASHLLTPRQTHSAKALFVTEPWDHDERPEADALVTDVHAIAVGVLTADCVPILLEGSGLVGAVHAGWRGSLRGVIASTVDLLKAHGADPESLRVAIGPHLRGPSFEVRGDLISEVTARFPDASRHFTRLNEEQHLYDHTGFVLDRLTEAGIRPDRIDDLGGDTLAEPERYFSYRAALRAGEKRFGHNITAIRPAG